MSIKLNVMKKLAGGLGDPSDPSLERINWNTVWVSWLKEPCPLGISPIIFSQLVMAEKKITLTPWEFVQFLWCP